MKLRLDRRDVVENIRVIVFQIIYDQGAWSVVDKFRAAIKVTGVVFVCFDHEERAITQPRRLLKIVRCAAYEITWIKTSLV